MSFIDRVIVGGIAAAAATVIGGPALGYIAWKGAGFLVTGNPLHLIPGTGHVADISDLASASDLADVATSELKYPPSSYE